MTQDIFALATRQNLQFNIPQGDIGVTDLWKIKYSVLENLEIELQKQVDSFSTTRKQRRNTNSRTADQARTELRLEIVSYILNVLDAEANAAREAQEIREHNAKIYAKIQKKEDTELDNLDKEELLKLLK